MKINCKCWETSASIEQEVAFSLQHIIWNPTHCLMSADRSNCIRSSSEYSILLKVRLKWLVCMLPSFSKTACNNNMSNKKYKYVFCPQLMPTMANQLRYLFVKMLILINSVCFEE
jgi:hypothetical protein